MCTKTEVCVNSVREDSGQVSPDDRPGETYAEPGPEATARLRQRIARYTLPADQLMSTDSAVAIETFRTLVPKS